MAKKRTVQRGGPVYKLQPGRQLEGRYIIGSFLGAGYEGEVYNVTEKMTGVERVVKFYYPHRYLDQQRSVRLARKLHRLRHCRVVLQYHHHGKIMRQGQEIGYVVSELAEGQMLEEMQMAQRGKRFTYFEALHITRALAVGVAPIHALREYHGDIHSENILVERYGIGFRVKIIDLYLNVKQTSMRARGDVIAIADMLYEMIGGPAGYGKSPQIVKDIVCGKRRETIARKFPNAGALRDFMNSYRW